MIMINDLSNSLNKNIETLKQKTTGLNEIKT